jgi:hypothetical protein
MHVRPTSLSLMHIHTLWYTCLPPIQDDVAICLRTSSRKGLHWFPSEFPWEELVSFEPLGRS